MSKMIHNSFCDQRRSLYYGRGTHRIIIYFQDYLCHEHKILFLLCLVLYLYLVVCFPWS